ncbi:MAG: FkbM family methyltransferase [Candidatus Paceibacterota bacterium]
MGNKVFTQFKKAEQDADPWYSFSHGGITPRIRRVFFLKHKYLVFNLYRLGLKKEALAKLFFGRRVFLPLWDPNALKIYFMGTLGAPRERNLTAFLAKNLKSNDIFYDVGANFGFYTFLGEHIITDGEVHSFEPNSRVFEYLRRNTADSEVFINMRALSNQVGTTTFFDSVEDSSSSGLFRQSARPADDYSKTKVEVTTLDEYVKTHNPPTIIKIDVEGVEYKVLNGGRSVIEKYKPTIIIEVWGGERGQKHHASAVKLLRDFGYQSFRIKEGGLLSLVETVDFNNIKRYENFIFKHKR